MAGVISVPAVVPNGADRPRKAILFSAVPDLRPVYGGGHSGVSDVRPVLFCFRGICRGYVCDCIFNGMAASAQRRRKADRLLAAALRGTAASFVCGVRFYAGLYPL